MNWSSNFFSIDYQDDFDTSRDNDFDDEELLAFHDLKEEESGQKYFWIFFYQKLRIVINFVQVYRHTFERKHLWVTFNVINLFDNLQTKPQHNTISYF